jgi:prophage antirepressor-like protein
VAEILGYTNASKALSDHVDDDDKLNNESLSSLGQRGGWLINESGLYSLILSSKLPTARKFKRWVTSEVLPSIRQNGMYGTDEFIERSLEDPEWAIGLLTRYKESRRQALALKETVAIQTQKIAELQPKADYHDLVLSCKDAVPISVIAKDYGWSARKLNHFLHQQGIQYKVNDTWVLYAEHADHHYTDSETYVYTDASGTSHANIFTKWNQKGRLFIYELMKAAGNLPLIEQERVSEDALPY